ncbi:class I SAM-dependent methyltransferase [Paenibacillus sp. RC67]|uniref:class I SAM-dependent methyltransferase n=1 Tax=Paenibacillus sp. RC67 TaxID=3039392 RepID=UPI0024AC8DB1|nr:class I SAM-dependent methyltransferase [Paenibacillus sp. RC67]
MIPEGNLKSNVDRFSGFEDVYDTNRPEAPLKVIEIVSTYLGKRPSVVADIGCGTGLSSFIWKDSAQRIIGVEPNDDMRGKAVQKASALKNADHITFMKCFSNELDMESDSVDIITCSQSFHWMEPVSTLNEISRVLIPGGVFAAYDCDWPPTLTWSIEEQYNNLIQKADDTITRLVQEPEQAHRWSKDKHLQRIRESGKFRFTKEIVFHNSELCNAQRYVGLTLSQGGLQTVFKLGASDLDADIATFKADVEAYFQGRTLEVMFSYRMRIGVK